MRLHGRARVGATFIDVLDDYADDLKAIGGRLYLSGLGQPLLEQLIHVGKLDANDSVQLLASHEQIGVSTREAFDAATQWRKKMLEF